MNKQREDMLWDTLDFLAGMRLSEWDYDFYIKHKNKRTVENREYLTEFIKGCILEYEEAD